MNKFKMEAMEATVGPDAPIMSDITASFIEDAEAELTLYIDTNSFNAISITSEGVNYSFPMKTFAKALLKILKEVENEDTV